MMLREFYTCLTIIICFWLTTCTSVYGQLTIRLTVQDAQCSSNGQISAVVEGGSGEYTYTLTNNCGDVFLPSRNPIFTTLPPCDYTLEVIDQQTNISQKAQTSINSTYQPIQAQIVIKDCKVAVETEFGRPPYKYAYSETGVGRFINNRGNPIMPDVDSETIWVTISDACGNDLTISGSTRLSKVTDFEHVQQPDGILIEPIGGSEPYVFTLKSDIGQYTNNTGFFPWEEIGCKPVVDITDQCQLDTIINQFVPVNILGADYCAKFSEGLVELTLESGNGPFKYSVITPSQTYTSDSNILYNIPSDESSYNFAIEDACGLKVNLPGSAPYRLDFNPAFRGCDDPQIAFSVNRNCAGELKFPLTLSCLSCDPVVERKSFNNFFGFTGQKPGEWDIMLTDACDARVRCRDSIMVEIVPACDSLTATLIDNFYCDNQLTSRRVIMDPSISYRLFNGAGTFIAANKTGVFKNLEPGTYEVVAFTDCGTFRNRASFEPPGPINPLVETYVNYTDLGNGCEILYDLKIEKEGGPYILYQDSIDNVYLVLNNYEQDNCQFYELFNLNPGKYILKSLANCGTVDFDLPFIEFDSIGSVTVDASCPSDSKISIEKQLWNTANWEQWFASRGITINNLNLNDRFFVDGLPYFDSQIRGLTPGTHTIAYYPGFANPNTSCFADKKTINIAPHIPPKMEISGNLLCDTASLAQLELTLDGSTPGFIVTKIFCDNSAPLDYQNTFDSIGTFQISDAPIGVYCFAIRDACGIVKDHQFEVGNYTDEIELAYTCDSTVIMSVDTLPLPFTWTNELNEVFETGSKAIAPVPANDTTFTVNIDLAECVVSRDIAVASRKINPLLSLPYPSDTIAFCTGDSVILEANTDFPPVSWNTGDSGNTLLVKQPGQYTASVSNDLGCSRSKTIEVLNLSQPQPIINGPSSFCFGDTITLTLNQAYNNISWSNGVSENEEIKINSSGWYAVTVADAFGCFGYDSLFVEALEKPSPKLLSPLGVCIGSQATISLDQSYSEIQWSTGVNNQASINVDMPGSYSVSVVADNGCSSSAEVSLQGWTLPEFNIDGDSVICTGRPSPLTVDTLLPLYSWSNGSTFRSINAVAGTYSVTATDDNGCSNVRSFTVEEKVGIEASLTGDTIICKGDTALVQLALTGFKDTANIVLSRENSTLGNFVVVGESVNIPFAFDQSAVISVVDVRLPDTYCPISIDENVQIEVKELPRLSIDAPEGFCEGTTATIQLKETFPVISWSTGTTNTDNIVIDTSGSFEVTVQDTNGCSAKASVDIAEWSLPEVNILGDSIICSELETNLRTAQTYASYTWSTGQQSASITAKVGSYDVTVTDQNGCQNTAIYTVESFPIISGILSGDTTICEEDTAFVQFTLDGYDGSATVTLGNESGPLGNWTIENNTTIIPLQVNSSRWVQVLDITAPEVACPIKPVGQVRLNVQALPTIDLQVPQGICEGESSSIQLTNTYENILWSTGEQNLTSLSISSGGEYSVTVSDNLGCQSNTSINIQDWALPEPSILGDSIICPGSSSLLSLNQSFSSYNWSNGSNASSIEGSAGISSVSVRDENGCQNSTSFEITEQAAYSATLKGDTIICEGERTFINFSIAAFKNNGFISVTNNKGFDERFGFQNGQLQIPLQPSESSTFEITSIESSAYECPIQILEKATIVVQPRPQPIIEAPAGICGKEEITLRLNENFHSIEWSNGIINQPSLPLQQGGQYGVTVSDIFGCSNSSSINIAQWEQPSFQILGKDTICPGEQTPLSIDQTFAQYNWSTGSEAANIVASEGSYSLTVTNSNGCQSTRQFELIARPTYSAYFKGDTSICFGDSANLFFNLEGYNGSGNITINNSLSGSSQWPLLNGIVNIPVNPRENTIVEVTQIEIDDNACSIALPKMVEISVRKLPQPDVVAPAGLCLNDNAQLSLKENYPVIQWSNGVENQQYITVNKAGIYSVMVRDELGCSNGTRVSLTEWEAPKFNITGQNIICGDQTTTLSTDNPFSTYNWSNGDTQRSIQIGEGTHSVTVTDQNGCIGEQLIEVVAEAPVIAQLQGDTAICLGDTALLQLVLVSSNSLMVGMAGSASTNFGDWQFADQGAQFPIYVEASQEVMLSSLELEDYNCPVEIQGSVNIEVLPLPEPQLTAEIATFCMGDTIDISLNQLFPIINWSNGVGNQSSIQVSQAGTYFAEVMDENGCSNKNVISVETYSAPAFNIIGDSIICDQDLAPLTIDNKFETYGWSNGSNERSIAVSGGSYTVTVTDRSGCTNTKQIFVEERPPLQVNLGIDKTIFLGEKLAIEPTTNAVEVSDWTWFVDGQPRADLQTWEVGDLVRLRSTQLELFVVDDNDCTAKGDIFITVDRRLRAFPPTAFSPNGDGANDFFFIFTPPDHIKEIIRFSVFDRWGSLVYEGKNLPPNIEDYGWDGNLGGRPAATGTYVWQAEFRLFDNSIESLNGSVSLMR